MVREAKFSGSEAMVLELPDLQDTFDDLDDRVLDDLPRPKPTNRHGERQSLKRPARRKTPQKHLAGADWISGRFPTPKLPKAE